MKPLTFHSVPAGAWHMVRPATPRDTSRHRNPELETAEGAASGALRHVAASFAVPETSVLTPPSPRHLPPATIHDSQFTIHTPGITLHASPPHCPCPSNRVHSVKAVPPQWGIHWDRPRPLPSQRFICGRAKPDHWSLAGCSPLRCLILESWTLSVECWLLMRR